MHQHHAARCVPGVRPGSMQQHCLPTYGWCITCWTCRTSIPRQAVATWRTGPDYQLLAIRFCQANGHATPASCMQPQTMTASMARCRAPAADACRQHRSSTWQRHKRSAWHITPSGPALGRSPPGPAQQRQPATWQRLPARTAAGQHLVGVARLLLLALLQHLREAGGDGGLAVVLLLDQEEWDGQHDG